MWCNIESHLVLLYFLTLPSFFIVLDFFLSFFFKFHFKFWSGENVSFYNLLLKICLVSLSLPLISIKSWRPAEFRLINPKWCWVWRLEDVFHFISCISFFLLLEWKKTRQEILLQGSWKKAEKAFEILRRFVRFFAVYSALWSKMWVGMKIMILSKSKFFFKKMSFLF